MSIATALAMLVAGPAHASKTQSSVFEDDHLLLFSGDAARVNALDEIKALGADTVHVLVVWSKLAPAPYEGVKPDFDAADPNSYGGWQPWDSLVAEAQARGLKVLLSPTGRAPAWATECKGSIEYRQRCSPRPADYGDFVHAVGARFPTVDEWSLWNEPNHSAWLVPQTGKQGGIRVNVAAMHYRRLVAAGLHALAQTGHARDRVLIGETAPLGSGHATAPVDFYRELFCLDRSYRPFRGAAARARGCSPRPKFAIDGVAHHPYTFAGDAKPSVLGRPNDAPIGALGRITRVLDAAGRYGIIPRRLPLYLTEFGFQTRPPDPFGVSLAEQARYINESDFIAYRNPRVASVAQYTLRDDPAEAGFNTGLRFRLGRAKPSLAAYALPIWLTATHGGHGYIWGQVRAARAPVSVVVQQRRNAKSKFTTVAEFQTNARGYFLQRLPRVAGQWRLKYGSHYSRIATVGA